MNPSDNQFTNHLNEIIRIPIVHIDGEEIFRCLVCFQDSQGVFKQQLCMSCRDFLKWLPIVLQNSNLISNCENYSVLYESQVGICIKERCKILIHY